jgi:hypothetical protein
MSTAIASCRSLSAGLWLRLPSGTDGTGASASANGGYVSENAIRPRFRRTFLDGSRGGSGEFVKRSNWKMTRLGFNCDPTKFRECVYTGLTTKSAVARPLEAPERHLGFVVDCWPIDMTHAGLICLATRNPRAVSVFHRSGAFLSMFGVWILSHKDSTIGKCS